MRILVIEDERNLALLIRRSLTEEGYAVDVAYDGREGELLGTTISFDLIILDIMLPLKDGFEICASLRMKGIKTRILFLSAKDSVQARVKGLDGGGDDYLVKPFDFSELSARIRTLLRREISAGNSLLRIGDISLDRQTHQVVRGDTPIDLTNKEFCILEYFIANPNIVITRRMLEDHCWNLSLNSESNLIEAYIQRLRRKIDIKGKPGHIQTIRGAGYRLIQK
ncbi:MAG: response regulator transcription factor [Dehalococcoidales bacterium]|nr:response regulator transcription factor [Dehalococcoidales bacterium]